MDSPRLHLTQQYPLTWPLLPLENVVNLERIPDKLVFGWLNEKFAVHKLLVARGREIESLKLLLRLDVWDVSVARLD